MRIVLTCCGRHAVFKSYGLKPLSVGGDWKEDINFSINMATYNHTILKICKMIHVLVCMIQLLFISNKGRYRGLNHLREIEKSSNVIKRCNSVKADVSSQ